MKNEKLPLVSTSKCNEKNANCSTISEIRDEVLPYCKTQKERWTEAFLSLTNEDLNVEGKTIKKGILKDIIEEPDKEKAEQIAIREFGETAILSETKGTINIYKQYFSNIESASQFKISKQVLSVLLNRGRATISNWCDGKDSPKYRDDIIKLAFWAKCTIEETNKLLACAGKHGLYIKGSGDSKVNVNSLVDAVYIHMLNHKNYSFANAQKLILETNRVIQKRIKIMNANAGMELKYDPSSDSENMEKLLSELGSSDSDFLTFIEKHIDNFIYDYQSLYDMLYKDFEEKYDINNKGVEEYRDSYKTSLNSLLGISSGSDRRWKNSLVKIVYAAIPPDKKQEQQKKKQNRQKKNMNEANGTQTPLINADFHTISRKDLIVLGLILNRSLNGVNELLGTCKEPPIYGKGIGECIIWNALETDVELGIDKFPEKAEDLYEAECIYTVFKKSLEQNAYIRKDENVNTLKPKIIKLLNMKLSEYETLYYEHMYKMKADTLNYKRSREEIDAEYRRKSPCCNALHSLQVFEWIKSAATEIQVKEVIDNLQDIFELYPEKQLFDYIVSFIAQEMEEDNS